MPTYLVGFAIGEYDVLEKKTNNGIICRIYLPLECKIKDSFALDVVVNCITYFEEYFGLAFPFPKLDVVGTKIFPHGKKDRKKMFSFALRYDIEIL